MRKLLNVVLTAVLAISFTLPAVAFAQPQDRDDHPKERAEGREEHPVIRDSIRKLKEVRNELTTKAAHDFAGHKTQAVKSIDEAIEHLNQALAADKK
jgi:hypothetical protein